MKSGIIFHIELMLKGELNYGKWAVNYQQIGILTYKDYDLFSQNEVGVNEEK